MNVQEIATIWSTYMYFKVTINFVDTNVWYNNYFTDLPKDTKFWNYDDVDTSPYPQIKRMQNNTL